MVSAPLLHVKGRVCQNEIEALVLVAVLEKCICIELSQIGLDTSYGKVHRGHLPGSGIALLAIDRQIVDLASMVLHEIGRLHEHATGSAARVVHTAMIGLDNLNQRSNNTGWGIELSGVLPFLLGKLRKTVLVGAPENVSGVALLGHFHIRE